MHENEYTAKHFLIVSTYLMACFSATSALPNNSFKCLRTNVTVTVTIAPAVTTFVFSSSITVRGKKRTIKNFAIFSLFQEEKVLKFTFASNAEV